MKFLNISLIILLIFAYSEGRTQTPCIDGLADSYPCDNVDLLARLTPDELLAEEHGGVLLNDIWGWTDSLTNKEYVLVGMANGTSFVDISDPINPIMLGILPEHHVAESGRDDDDEGKSIWRDIKVYQNYAFIVSEDITHGMQIFDLTDLRDVPNAPQTFLESGHYDGFGKAHNLVINEATGYAYAVGSREGGTNCTAVGGLHVINIQDPTNPVYVACFDDDGYTHDAQCVIYNGSDPDYQGKEICFNSNEDTITIVDVEDKGNMQMISKTTYAGSSYTHQGWLTEDHNYFLSNDELDERNGLTTNTKTFIWDVRDLDAPVLIGEYLHSTTSIDHNLYTVGSRVFESNYTSGLRILDISDIANANLEELGYFDTYPQNDDPNFIGSWSNYPFFESGVVAVSDIRGGLFLVRPRYEAFVTQHPENSSACVGEPHTISIEVIGEGLTLAWQWNDDAGFQDITEGTAYSNTTSTSLQLNSTSLTQNQYQFRCEITTPSGKVYYTNFATVEVFDSDAVIADFEYSIIGNNVSFTSTSYAATSYSWDFGDESNNATNKTSENQYAYETRSYTVTLTASNECSSDVIMKEVNIVVSGLGKHIADLKMYPVPAKDWLTVETSHLQNVISYSVYTLDGKTVQSGNLSFGNNSIDVSELDKGMYILTFQSADQARITRRLLID